VFWKHAVAFVLGVAACVCPSLPLHNGTEPQMCVLRAVRRPPACTLLGGLDRM